MDKDLMLLTDVECDNYVGALLAKGFESDEYTSAVEAMYGAGFESAFIDDGFFASLKRGIRNLTTFKQAIKLNNIISDIKNLSVEKIAQGDTRGVTFDAKSFAVLKAVLSSKVLNVANVEAKYKELISHLESMEANTEVSGVINSIMANDKRLAKGNPGRGSLGAVADVTALGGGMFLAWILKDCKDGLSLINTVKVLTTSSKALAGITVLTGLAIITSVVTLFMGLKDIIAYFKGKKTQNTLTEAESGAIDAINKTCSICVEIAKTLVGVKLDSTNIEKELESAAKRDKIDELKSILSNKAKTISYDDKVKIVQELQGLLENEGAVRTALDSKSVKKSIDSYVKIDSKLEKWGVSVGEGKVIRDNAKSVFAYANKVTDLILSSISAVLDDCKKY